MRRYLIYPEAKEKLKCSGLEERIKQARKDHKIPILGAIYEDDILNIPFELKAGGFLKTLPKEEGEKYKSDLNMMFKSKDNFSWKVFNSGKKPEKIPIEWEDFYTFTGLYSSIILSPDEIWDYKRFGFNSLFEFTGTVGAALIKISDSQDGLNRVGYKWNFKKDDKNITTNITGNMHLDLLIERSDNTPYKTIDPLGNTVQFRPEYRNTKYLSAYHSTECSLLVTLLRYIEQLDIKIPELENGAKELIEWSKTLGQVFGNAADAGFDSGFGVANKFNNGLPIPVLNKRFQTNKNITYFVLTSGGGLYEAHIGPNQELMFSFRSEKDIEEGKKKITKEPDIFFYPEEAKHLIKGLFVQASKGLGRTSVKQLRDVVEFRFSKQYDDYIEEYGIKVPDDYTRPIPIQ